MSAAGRIRLSRFWPHRSPRRLHVGLRMWRRFPPFSGGWTAAGTAGSPRLPSLPDGKESQAETPLLEPVRAFSGRMRGCCPGLRLANMRLYASRLRANADPDASRMVAPAGLGPAPPPLAGAQPGITRNHESHVAVSLQFGVQPTGPSASGSRRTVNLAIKPVAAG